MPGKTTRAGQITGNLLPKLRRRRSSEQAARVAAKQHMYDLVQSLEARRAELGITRAAVARELGVAQPMISKIFSGRIKNIQLLTLLRVAEVLDSDVELELRPRA